MQIFGVFLAFLVGLGLGTGLGWYLLQRHRQDDAEQREALHAARLKQLHDEVAQADGAHAETKERLIALQQEHLQLERRAEALAAGLGQAPRAGEAGAAAAAAGPPPAPDPAAGDDLTRIKGIGKVMERKLAELGVTSFRQLADLSPAEIQRINAAIEFPGRVERERWVEQARAMAPT